MDCLFTREFWTRFTWTGISRGQKSKRGFREFGNVLQLLVNLVCIGDPSYTAQKLEEFCRTRLFRYSMSRSTSKRLRKSACRPERKSKKVQIDGDEMIDNPAALVDVIQTDSAEENDEYQDETNDQGSNEADSEHDNDDDDDNCEDVFNASDNDGDASDE